MRFADNSGFPHLGARLTLEMIGRVAVEARFPDMTSPEIPDRATGGAAARAIVYVVDPDSGIRASVAALVEHLGFSVQGFSSAEQFLESADCKATCCIVADTQLPGMSGLDLLARLQCDGEVLPPVIFVASHSDVSVAVRALKAGAVDFIEKPFLGRELLGKIEHAVELLKRGRKP